MNRWFRKLHRWGAIATAVPLLLVIVSGLLLQVKKEVTWIQPETMRGEKGEPTLSFEQMLEIAKRQPEAKIETWEDIARLDIRPDRGLIKLTTPDHWELQLDARTGQVLASNYRRSDWIEQLHDGSFFHDSVKLWVFLPNGLVLLGLWFTGVYLWWLPISVKRRKRRSPSQRAPSTSDSP